MRSIYLAAILAAASATGLSAQIDYRDLDAERPLLTEDAYPLERGALELSLPYTYERVAGAGLHFLTPQFELGLDNAQLTFEWPMGRAADGSLRSFGPRLGLLYNPFTQPRRWPAVALGVDAAVLEGGDGRPDGRLTARVIATRSFGVTRLHLNGSVSAGPETPKYTAEFPPRLRGTIALDRSIWRQSLLLGLEGGVAQEVAGAPTSWLGGVGMRWQWTPIDVLDLGYRLTAEGDGRTGSFVIVGLSHNWGRGHPSHREAPAGVPRLDRRDGQFYVPGAFNWAFRRTQNEAARLFNAFDYGHAILYERMNRERGAVLDSSLAEAYRYLTTDLLVRSPRFGIAEEAVMPGYAEEFWRAKQVFEWAHLLHRQIYDAYADAEVSGRGPQATDSMIEALTDRYLERREYALAPVPKMMELMEGQPYSGEFKREQPEFNGLIWAYHWLQVGLYEPYARGTVGSRRSPALDRVVTRFREMVATERYPEVMPMTSAVAPIFTAAHPRAAAIFDNLHSLHDVISDILLNDTVVPRAGKRAAVYQAIAAYQDTTAQVEADEHWKMKGEMVGGVDRMGGAVP